MTTLGRHVLIELSGCNPEKLGDLEFVRKMMLEATHLTNATILKTTFHRFYPQGVSGVVVVSESHLAIHTWPEYGYAALDIYTCGEHTDPIPGAKYIAEALESKHVRVSLMIRGLSEGGEVFSHRVHSLEPGANLFEDIGNWGELERIHNFLLDSKNLEGNLTLNEDDKTLALT